MSPFGGPFGHPFWGPFGSPFGAPSGIPLGSLLGPGGGKAGLREANEVHFVPGRLQRRVPSFRTSEFWRPVLSDLEAKNLDSLEEYSLVAKGCSRNSLVAPQGGFG